MKKVFGAIGLLLLSTNVQSQQRSVVDAAYAFSETNASFKADLQNNSNGNVHCSNIDIYFFTKQADLCQPLKGESSKISLKNLDIPAGRSLTLSDLGQLELAHLSSRKADICQKLFFDFNCKVQD